MGFQMKICLILCFSWSIILKSCDLFRTSSSKTQMLFLKTVYCRNIDYFVIDSSRLHLTFVVIHKQ